MAWHETVVRCVILTKDAYIRNVVMETHDQTRLYTQ